MKKQFDVKTPIKRSPFADFFEDVEATDIFLLCKEDADQICSTYIDSSTNSYWFLKDDHPLLVGKRECIGDWSTPYNNDDNSQLSLLLEDKLEWNGDDVIYYIINRDTVLETSWRSFLKFWDAFIAAKDECPFIVSSTDKENTLLINPNGEVFLYRSAHLADNLA